MVVQRQTRYRTMTKMEHCPVADLEVKARLKQILDVLPTLATKADVAAVEIRVD